MIVVINSQGRVVAQQNDDLFQGSVKANIIDLVAPFSDNVTFKASVELPDGTILPENSDGYTLKQSVNLMEGLNVWKLPINFPISRNYGIITIQFRGTIGSQTVCTGIIKLPIQKGVPYEATQDIEPSLYDELVAMISDLKGLLNGKVDVVNTEYLPVSYVTEDTVGYFYTYNSETDQYTQVVLPEQFTINTQYYTIGKTGRIVNTADGIYIEYKTDDSSTKIEVLSDRVTINGQQIVVFKDLIAQNVGYNGRNSGIDAINVQEAVDKLKYAFNELGNSQVIDVGEFVFKSTSWYYEDGIYKINYTNKLFTDALVQGVIVTPNKEAIDNLNNNDILIYSEIDIEQLNNNVAVAKLKADKKPDFDIVANVKIQGTTIDAQTEGIKADQIKFDKSEEIKADTVQKAIEEVQYNLTDFEGNYITEKSNFVKLDENGKIPAGILPGFVDNVVEGYLYQTQFYETKTEDGYTNVIVPVEGKVYIDLDTNKTYRWGGTQFVIIQSDLALGTKQGTAYDGGNGQANRDDINAIIKGDIVVNKALNDAKGNNIEGTYAKQNGVYADLTAGLSNMALELSDNGIIGDNATAKTQDLSNKSNNVSTTEFVHNYSKFKKININATIKLEMQDNSSVNYPIDFEGYGQLQYSIDDNCHYWIGTIQGMIPKDTKRRYDVYRVNLRNILIDGFIIDKIINGGLLAHKESDRYDDQSTIYYDVEAIKNTTNECYYYAENPSEDWALNEQNCYILISNFIVKFK